MLVRVGLQTNVESKYAIAWLLDYPGCFVSKDDETEALLASPRALLDYQAWIGKHTSNNWLAELGDFDVRLVETWKNYSLDPNYELTQDPKGYEVDAWFRHDWKALTAEEVERALSLLSWTRQDLLAAVSGLSQEQMDETRPGERWSIGGILNHVGGAEWWYLERLGLAGMEAGALPKDPFEHLARVRARLLEVLPRLVGVKQVVGREGELWSPRKVVRRALWHERDHTGHIYKLIFQ